ncbi:integral membrane protein [Desulfocucumis palustris]|uniref:Integral membrane protein n=1 Tax=Desulfocucumis palustris TaxID=1898651 RepID=A0A2L2X9J8_9FIRM|nr:TerC family protein [Desulfocucumis palustris]GBF32937.1 integral membrane protein [Desulfocucumis palustris]
MTPFELLSALFSIIIIDIILGGDNAVVIAMASRCLPEEQRKKAIIWGTVGAVAARAALTGVALFLLKVPLLHLVGGLFLIWIAVKLLTDRTEMDPEVKTGKSLFEAIKIIVVADLIMGVDNVIGVAGAAHGHFLLVVGGLAISVPIIVWGSSMILRLMVKFPAIIYIGAGVLTWTAGKMIAEDKIIHNLLRPYNNLYEIIIPAVITVIVILIGVKINSRPVEKAEM